MSNTTGADGPGTPPGWYKDAQGSMRWWDGSGWTERTQEYQPAIGSSYGQPLVEANAAAPWYKKRGWQIAGAVLAVFIIIGATGDTEEASDDLGTAAADTNSTTESQASEASASESESASESAAPSETAKASPKPKPKPAAAPVAMPVDAASMLKEFDGNEAAADAKYKGKTLRVSGTAVKVDTDFWDDEKYVIQINGGGDWDFLTVNCNDVSAEQAAKVQVDSPVTVVGAFDDGGDLGVELKDCNLA